MLIIIHSVFFKPLHRKIMLIPIELKLNRHPSSQFKFTNQSKSREMKIFKMKLGRLNSKF